MQGKGSGVCNPQPSVCSGCPGTGDRGDGGTWGGHGGDMGVMGARVGHGSSCGSRTCTHGWVVEVVGRRRILRVPAPGGLQPGGSLATGSEGGGVRREAGRNFY